MGFSRPNASVAATIRASWRSDSEVRLNCPERSVANFRIKATLGVWSRNAGSAWLIPPHSGTRHLVSATEMSSRLMSLFAPVRPRREQGWSTISVKPELSPRQQSGYHALPWGNPTVDGPPGRQSLSRVDDTPRALNRVEETGHDWSDAEMAGMRSGFAIKDEATTICIENSGPNGGDGDFRWLEPARAAVRRRRTLLVWIARFTIAQKKNKRLNRG